jgi:hypothetical protein
MIATENPGWTAHFVDTHINYLPLVFNELMKSLDHETHGKQKHIAVVAEETAALTHQKTVQLVNSVSYLHSSL